MIWYVSLLVYNTAELHLETHNDSLKSPKTNNSINKQVCFFINLWPHLYFYFQREFEIYDHTSVDCSLDIPLEGLKHQIDYSYDPSVAAANGIINDGAMPVCYLLFMKLENGIIIDALEYALDFLNIYLKESTVLTVCCIKLLSIALFDFHDKVRYHNVGYSKSFSENVCKDFSCSLWSKWYVIVISWYCMLWYVGPELMVPRLYNFSVEPRLFVRESPLRSLL